MRAPFVDVDLDGDGDGDVDLAATALTVHRPESVQVHVAFTVKVHDYD